MILSIFSFVYWLSVCLLWRNVCLGLLPIFWLGFFFFKIYLFLAVLGLCCWVQALSRAGCGEQGLFSSRCAQASLCGVLAGCGARALGSWVSGCGTWAQWSHDVWGLPRPGMEPVSPALAGRFWATGPPGKSSWVVFWFWVVWAVSIFWKLIPCWLHHLQIFSPIL